MPDKILIQTWVPREIADPIRARARAAERSVAAEVRLALRSSVDASRQRPAEQDTTPTPLAGVTSTQEER